MVGNLDHSHKRCMIKPLELVDETERQKSKGQILYLIIIIVCRLSRHPSNCLYCLPRTVHYPRVNYIPMVVRMEKKG